MNGEQEITELLQNYRSYEMAVYNFERHHPVPSAGVARYTGMPNGSGAPERFFANPGKMADMGTVSLADIVSYQEDVEIVDAVRGALYTLTEGEREIIVAKWMDDIPLKTIAQKKSMGLNTVKRTHRRALTKVVRSLRFVPIPHIHRLDKVCAF
jgi:hypothetical protein